MKTITIFLMLLLMVAMTWAINTGQTCYTKKKSTPLLSSPDRESAAVTTVPWGTELEVKAVQGHWLKVASEKGSGWIFGGNVSEREPMEENHNDFLPTAGDTGAAIAARPLSPAAEKYADRKGRAEAAADVQWMENQADRVTRNQVVEYQKAGQVGEYAP